MKFNLFSILLVILITFGTAKTISLVDRILGSPISNFKNKPVKSNFLLIDSAVAQENKDPSTLNDAINENTNTNLESTNNNNNLLSSFQLSEYEIKLLKELSKRREELDKREGSIKLKENLLNSTEERIEKQMRELADLKNKVENLIQILDKKEDEKIMKLARIYENMKPKDAARIFNQMEIDLIISIIRLMKENRVAPIIANMNPMKAKEISSIYSEKNEIK